MSVVNDSSQTCYPCRKWKMPHGCGMASDSVLASFRRALRKSLIKYRSIYTRRFNYSSFLSSSCVALRFSSLCMMKKVTVNSVSVISHNRHFCQRYSFCLCQSKQEKVCSPITNTQYLSLTTNSPLCISCQEKENTSGSSYMIIGHP